MLAHGDLAPAWRAAVLRLHLVRCPECRGRYDAMVTASLAFSDALRGGGAPARLRGPVWPAALATAHAPLRWPRIVLPAGTAAVVLVGGAVLIGRTHSGAAVPATAAAAAAAPHLCHGIGGALRAPTVGPPPAALTCEKEKPAPAAAKAGCSLERAALRAASPKPRASAVAAVAPSPAAPHSCE